MKRSIHRPFRRRALVLAAAALSIGGCAGTPGHPAAGPAALEAHRSPPAPLDTGRILDPVTSLADPEQSYAVELPRDYSPARRWPVLFVLDPRGRGRLGAELFRQGPERHGWIVMSSNGTSSDGPWEPNVRAMKAMLADADTRFAVDPRRLYLAGFSGTARGAWAFAVGMGANVAGVIVASGGAPLEHPPGPGLGFAVFGTAGTRDFNHLEMRDLDERLDEIDLPHRFEVFAGEHDWPPAEVAGEAIAWLELRAMRRGLAAPDERLANELHDRWLGEARADEDAGAIDDAVHAYREMERDFAGTTAAADAHAEIERLTAMDAFAAQTAARKQAERWERSQRAEVERIAATFASTAHIDDDATRARARELMRSLRSVAADGAEPARAAAAQRVLEHLFSFLAFYTPRELSEHGAYGRAALVLDLAISIHGDRSAVWYDLACARARAGKTDLALDALETAAAKGFADRKLLETDDDLASLRGTGRYRDLLAAWPAAATRSGAEP